MMGYDAAGAYDRDVRALDSLRAPWALWAGSDALQRLEVNPLQYNLDVAMGRAEAGS